MKAYKIASIPDDDIWVEIVDAVLRALHVLVQRTGIIWFDVKHFNLCTDRC